MSLFSNYNSYFTYKDEVSKAISWGHWFTFLNIFLTLLLGISYLYNSPSPATTLGIFYLVISWLGHFSCLCFILFMLLLFPITFIGSLKTYKVYSIVVTTILFAIMLIDIKLYQQIKIHLGINVVELFLEQDDFSTGINFNFLFIAIPLIILVECYFSHLAWKHIYVQKYKKLTTIIISVFLLCFFSTHIFNIWASAYHYVPITQQKTIFPAYYPMTANTFLAEHGWIETPKQQERQIEIQYKNIKYPLETIKVIPKENPYNVLIILIDELNYDHSIGNNSQMPLLKEIAQSHDNYINHYLGVTELDASVFELIYGLPAQYLSFIRSERYTPTILSEMYHQDYKIQAFSTTFPKQTQIVKKFTSMMNIPAKSAFMFKNDTETVRAFLSKLPTWKERPQFTTIALNALYTEKNCQEEVIEDNNSTENQTSNNENISVQYKKCLNKLDNQISSIIRTIKDYDLLSNTVVFITSSKAKQQEQYKRENFHAPLIALWPDSVIPSKITAITGLQDIAPTIAKEVLGIQNNYEAYSTGISIRDISIRPWILSGNIKEFQIITNKQTTIFDKQGNASIYTDDNASDFEQPNMVTLIKAMKILNKFKETN